MGRCMIGGGGRRSVTQKRKKSITGAKNWHTHYKVTHPQNTRTTQMITQVTQRICKRGNKRDRERERGGWDDIDVLMMRKQKVNDG